jgi:hypothetical protein
MPSSEINMEVIHPEIGEIFLVVEKELVDGGEHDETLAEYTIVQLMYGSMSYGPADVDDDLLQWAVEQIDKHAWRYCDAGNL